MRSRWFVAVILLLAACGGGDGGPDAAPDAAVPLGEVTDPLEYVDPRIGTGGLGFGYGSAFVGAAVPHGLVKLGPDTNGPLGTAIFQHYSGYWAGDDRVQSFSHLHLHGAGLADYGVIAIMPTLEFDPAQTDVAAYERRFSAESARPGRYRVELDGGIAVDLVATARAASERYTFGDAGGWLVIDLGKTLDGDVSGGSITVDAGAALVTGTLHHAGPMSGNYGGYDVHVAIRAATAWTAHQVWHDGPAAAGDTATGDHVGAALRFAGGAPVELRVGVSLVSIDGALANLDAEAPASIDHEALAAAAADQWRALTGVVKVTGGTVAERRTFYTALYHAFLMPTVISDADGSYQLAGGTPMVATGRRQLSDLSLWDTYRTVHPLYGWLAPDAARESVRSLVAFDAETGGFPRWPIAIGESGTMLGACADVVIGDAVAKGLIDVAEVGWPRLRAAALETPVGGRGGSQPYLDLHYMPASTGRSVSNTTELSHDDFALIAVAEAAGATADAELLRTRRLGWRQLFDARVGFLRARAADGEFAPLEDFDPTDETDEFAEANAWQSLWMSGSHDPDGLAELFGSPDGAIAKLTEMFELSADDWETADPSAANFPRPYYWHGNEPDIAAPFLFAQLGRPDLAQQWVRWVMTTQYSDTPEGLAGNDDGGTLASWYVFAALGVYPIPGSDRYIVGAPLFPRARVVVDGHELVIEAPGAGAAMPYVAAVTLDGAAVSVPELTHAQLTGASELVFTMSATPTTWGQ